MSSVPDQERRLVICDRPDRFHEVTVLAYTSEPPLQIARRYAEALGPSLGEQEVIEALWIGDDRVPRTLYKQNLVLEALRVSDGKPADPHDVTFWLGIMLCYWCKTHRERLRQAVAKELQIEEYETQWHGVLIV